MTNVNGATRVLETASDLRAHGALVDVDHPPPQLPHIPTPRLGLSPGRYDLRRLVLHGEDEPRAGLEVLHGVLHVVGRRPPQVVGATHHWGARVLGRFHLGLGDTCVSGVTDALMKGEG